MPAGPTDYDMISMRRITIQGFIVLGHLSLIMESMIELGGPLQEGKLKSREDARESKVTDYHNIVTDLYNGGNSSKLIMRIAPDP